MTEEQSELKKKRKNAGDSRVRRLKRRKILYSAASAAVTAVIVFTVYMLKMPGVTLEKQPVCGLEEHTHSTDCYSAVTTELSSMETVELSDDESVLSCGLVEHTHTDSCYETEQENSDTQSDSAQEESAADEQVDNESESQAEEITGETEIVEAQDSETTSSQTASVRRKASKARSASSEFVLTDSYLTSLKLYYKCPDNTDITEWSEVTDTVVLHGDDSLKLDVKYASVAVSDVINSDNKMYYELPEWMKGADESVVSNLFDGSANIIGKIYVKDNRLVAEYDSTWLASHSSGSTLEGSMSMEAEFAADYVKTRELKIGSITINVDYEAGVWESCYGTVEIEKSDPEYIESDDGADLLQYTLTVSTGATDMKNISVKDYLKNIDSDYDIFEYIDGIVDITETDTQISDTSGPKETSTDPSFTHGTISFNRDGDHTVIWNIGDMSAGEVRKLTYQIRLNKDKTGLVDWSGKVFFNIAELYADGNERDAVSNSYKNFAKDYVGKTLLSYVADEDGVGGTVIYCLVVQETSDSTYDLHNLKLYDYYASGYYDYSNRTYDVTLDRDSFHLYDVGSANVSSNANIIKQIEAAKKNGGEITITDDMLTLRQVADSTKDGDQFKDFTCYVGDLTPGQSKLLVYSGHINSSYYLANNSAFTLQNYVTLYDDDTKHSATVAPNQNYVDRNRSADTFSYSEWEHKYNPERVEKAATIEMGTDNVYHTVNSQTVLESDQTNFKVAVGNYQYHVIVNQNGEIDVSSVDLKDSLSSYMQYTGFLKVDAYDSLSSETLSSLNPGEIHESVVAEAWLNIDGQTSFSFKPEDLGFSGKYTYVLTYYTKLVNYGSALSVSVTNNFQMSGGTGAGGTYVFPTLKVSVKSTAVTSTNVTTSKSHWYYEVGTNDSTQTWGRGELYWYIQLKGNYIPSGFELKDSPEVTNKIVENDSFAGIYVLDNSLTLTSSENYAKIVNSSTDKNAYIMSLADLQEKADEQLSEEYYSIEWDSSNNAFTIKFENGYTIPDGKVVYAIAKTSPNWYPQNVKEGYTYKNILYQRNNSSQSFQYVGSASYQLKGGKSTTKTFKELFTYDGEGNYRNLQVSDDKQYTSSNLGYYGNYTAAGYAKKTLSPQTPESQVLQKSGTYIHYEIDCDKNGTLNGDNIVYSDILPEGTELAFLRNEWFHGGSITPQAITAEIPEIEEDIAEKGDESEWVRYEIGNKPDCGGITTGYCISYYNTVTREVRWAINNVMVANGGVLDYQMVIRITDPEVLLGVKEGVYNNSVTAYKDSKFVETAAAGTVTVKKTPLTKGVAGSIQGNSIPFKIVVNETGDDLDSENDSIVFVDEMSTSMVVDLDSISITDQNGKEVTDVHIAMEKTDDITYLRFTIPDDKKLTITYKATVEAADGTTASVSNVAHWEGLPAASDSEYENKSLKINLSGFTIAKGPATLRLSKRNSEDIVQKLSNAEFTMQEAILNSDGTYTLTGIEHTGKTDENGEILFSGGSDRWMKYDTIYCIKETVAPEGYILDTEPQYIVLESGNVENEYPDEVEVQINTDEFEFVAIDKPYGKYVLPKAGGEGTENVQSVGVLLLTAAGMYVLRHKRRV